MRDADSGEPDRRVQPASHAGPRSTPRACPDAAEWEALARAALAAGRDGPPAGVPDGFRYRITVGDRTVHCADPRLTEAQRTLIARILQEGA